MPLSSRPESRGCATTLPTYGNDPPAADEIEVSIFGPGKGESIVVHLGDNHWIVVDSCRDQTNGEIPPLAYLNSMEVALKDAVRLVVGTHAHDDHIAGLSSVYEACEASSFVCSAALSTDEFYALAEDDERVGSLVRERVYREYRSIFDIARTRPRSLQGRRPLIRATERLSLLSIPVQDTQAEILAISPSQEALTRSIRKLADGALRLGELPRSPAADPNELAVALWITVGNRSILLGADLLKGPVGCGWQGALDWHRPARKAEVVKVPHHGAPNAHWAPMWADLAVPEPLALLAPYRGGKTKRPAPDDIVRILELTPDAYITASPRRLPPSSTVRGIGAMINQVGRNVQDPWGKVGHVRARAQISEGHWQVQCMPPASHLFAYR
ncbi:MBL fold metallo-hydrolase [Cryptosporangium sp. NPDC051539]|uniref:MBL fold metallo-hydrolase n=1 Tax=Cryptosporangium sp. NPDC051539 TaxID=3363962 RepID=UPI003797C34E